MTSSQYVIKDTHVQARGKWKSLSHKSNGGVGWCGRWKKTRMIRFMACYIRAPLGTTETKNGCDQYMEGWVWVGEVGERK